MLLLLLTICVLFNIYYLSSTATTMPKTSTTTTSTITTTTIITTITSTITSPTQNAEPAGKLNVLYTLQCNLN